MKWLASIALVAACYPSALPSSDSAFARVGTAPAAALPPLETCDFRWGYHGTVAGAEVFLRLERKDDALAGRYFYAKAGVDIALAGHIDGERTIELIEGDAHHPTGRFTGKCDGASARFEGTWRNDAGARPFLLERVGPRASPLIADKRVTLTRKAASAGVFGQTQCAYTQRLIELFGAGTPEAERALNHQGPADLARRIVWPDTYAAVEACETYVEAEYSESIARTFDGLVTIDRGGYSVYDGALHANNYEGAEETTYDLATGNAVTERVLFARFPGALVKRCVASFAARAPDHEAADLYASAIDGHTFAIEPRGVRVFATNFPPYAGALTLHGPVLTWSALLREGALRADSPAKGVWQGIAPDASAAACLDEEGDALP